MNAIRSKLGEGGRIIIPANFRQMLHLTKGDDIILHCDNESIFITTPNKALRTLQNKLKNHPNSLADELIAKRKAEVLNEE
jgi:bifunctional DNA-binding transcriptional regulator/antitoxin component of YhaV-PrlF toxin-antitoxin module